VTIDDILVDPHQPLAQHADCVVAVHTEHARQPVDLRFAQRGVFEFDPVHGTSTANDSTAKNGAMVTVICNPIWAAQLVLFLSSLVDQAIESSHSETHSQASTAPRIRSRLSVFCRNWASTAERQIGTHV
jgi:hypothetical protein